MFSITESCRSRIAINVSRKFHLLNSMKSTKTNKNLSKSLRASKRIDKTKSMKNKNDLTSWCKNWTTELIKTRLKRMNSKSTSKVSVRRRSCMPKICFKTVSVWSWWTRSVPSQCMKNTWRKRATLRTSRCRKNSWPKRVVNCEQILSWYPNLLHYCIHFW